MITLEQLEDQYLILYERKSPMLINGKLIPLKNICKLQVTSSLLLDDEIELFALKNNFPWSNSHKDELTFLNTCDDETDVILRNPFLKSQSLFRNKNAYFVALIE